MFGVVGGACARSDVLCTARGLPSKESLMKTVPCWVQVVQLGCFLACSLASNAKELLFKVRSSLMYTEEPFNLILRPYTSSRSLVSQSGIMEGHSHRFCARFFILKVKFYRVFYV